MTEDYKSKFNILVTDDSPLACDLITQILDKENYNVIGHANSAEEAYIKAQTENIHLHVIDVVMPNVSGIDLARSLNEMPHPKCLLMISSLDSEGILIEAISTGANDFLRKPFKAEDLISSVDKLLKYTIKEILF